MKLIPRDKSSGEYSTFSWMKKTIWGSLELRLPYYKLLNIALVLDIIIYLKYIVTTMKIQLKTKVLLFWGSPCEDHQQVKNIPCTPQPDHSDFFWFSEFLKNAGPPFGSNSYIFLFENILTNEDPLGQTS